MTAPNIAYDLGQLLAGEALQERLHAGGSEIGIRLRIVLGDAFGEAAELSIGLVLGNTGFQAAKDLRPVGGGIAAGFERELIVKRDP